MERVWFKNRLPVLWWDQPTRFRDPANAFEELVSAAERQLKKLNESNRRPIGLIAHSSGAQIAVELTRRVPERIRSLTLLSCSASVPEAFVRLGSRLAAEHGFLEPLVASAEARLSAETFWPLLRGINSIPSFTDCYWKSASARARYNEIAKGCRPLHAKTFQLVMENLLDRPPLLFKPGGIDSKVPVNCFFGTHDLLQDIEDAGTRWSRIFPWARLHRLDCGHFPQFETAVEAWFKPFSTS
ncbi:MAG: alpha/beta hydrolase [Oligoflexia bacterium]|nr:alpha/beta hydrolase [Oligoflexia bacterium]